MDAGWVVVESWLEATVRESDWVMTLGTTSTGKLTFPSYNYFLFIILKLTFIMLASSRTVFSALKRSARVLDAKRLKSSGRVKFFDTNKGFGFITPDEGGEDLFVHYSHIYAKGFKSLAVDEEVEYDVELNPREGTRYCINVTGPNGEHVCGQPENGRKIRQKNEFDDDSR